MVHCKPANPYGYTSGFEDAYPLKALATLCDYIMLMAYDEHYPGDTEAGPVASLPFVEQSIQSALTQIPSTQLVLGIPFYGRLWNGLALASTSASGKPIYEYSIH
ncbi:MAG: glycosyl hydrolase family 18 protein [Paenibacillaceae bacterium]